MYCKKKLIERTGFVAKYLFLDFFKKQTEEYKFLYVMYVSVTYLMFYSYVFHCIYKIVYIVYITLYILKYISLKYRRINLFYNNYALQALFSVLVTNNIFKIWILQCIKTFAITKKNLYLFITTVKLL